LKAWTAQAFDKIIVIFIYLLSFEGLMPPGRPRCPRRIETEPSVSYFKPQGVPLKDLEVVVLSLEELEVVRLVDLVCLDQEQAAMKMGISRRALWDDLQNARRKIIEALVMGKAIEIAGGDYVVVQKASCLCNCCHSDWQAPAGSDDTLRCPKCGSEDVHQGSDEKGSATRRGCHGGCGKGGQNK
jgi:uncharacterized protein